jgi:hypothetical protein
MPNEWSFRLEILKATRKWPWLLLFCLIGSLAGWVIAYVWPSPYRITRELYVGLNVYRAIDSQTPSGYTGIEVVNANDYKNWQMSSLNTLIFMDSVIGETLDRLKEIDPYWQRITSTELAESLHVYWRNAGKWRLVAENTDPRRATEAVTVWQDVVVDHVHQAVLDSQQALILDLQLRALEEQQSQINVSAETIKHVRDLMQSWIKETNVSTSSSPISSTSRWQLWQLAQLDVGPGWKLILQAFPSEGQPHKAYVDWVGKAGPVMEQSIEALEIQSDELENESKVTASQYSEASQKSHGLSPTLDVDKVSDLRAQETVNRPTGIMMLVGSVIGFFACMTIWISQISLRGKV